MTRNFSESLTFTLPIALEYHAIAEQFRLNHGNPKKAKQVYLNTLAVSAVKFYLDCMGVETNSSASDSWNPLKQTLIDVADLEIIGLGKIECRPVLSDEEVVHIPPEVWSDRIGYVAVQFDNSLREATLLGFSKTAESGYIPINQLRSLEEFIFQLNVIPEKVKQKIHLSQWLINVVDVGWQTVESLLTQQSEQIYLAIRNRTPHASSRQSRPTQWLGYTNKVRLRGLKKFETHGGGFCLYSREFHSPGLGRVFTKVRCSQLAFRFRSAEQTLAQNPENSSISVEKARLLELGGELSSKAIALIVGLLPTSEQEINIYVKVCPVGSQKYLPEELELMVLDEKGTVMQAIARTTKSIQLNFSSQLGENFSIKVSLGDVSFTEVFLV